MRPLPGLVVCALALSGCVKWCDPRTSPDRCDGNVMEFCQSTHAAGFDFGASLERRACTLNNVCALVGEHAACVHPPQERCEPGDFVPRCEGENTLSCQAVSSFSDTTWVVASACAWNMKCGATELGAGCVNR